MSISTAKKAKEININTAWCKGCGICVEVCPKDVLAMNRLVATVIQLDKCILCRRYEDNCPDFCIDVVPMETENGSE